MELRAVLGALCALPRGARAALFLGSGGAARLGSPSARWLGILPAAFLGCLVAACGTVDPGEHFQVAEVVYDESYFYCSVEPMLFAQRCGAGDPEKGDAAGGCHFSIPRFRLIDYPEPRVSAGCQGNVPAPLSVTDASRQNYQSAQRQMDRDPERAPLLTRPTQRAAHPRVIFAADSAEADRIREWATRFSSR